MAIESKNLLVWIKAMSRGSNLPLDSTEIHDSLEAAQTYANTPTAYAGQTIKALVDGKYKSYIIQPSESGYTLEESGSTSSNVKQYVQIVDVLPASGQEEGIIYISDTTGSIWTGTGWKTVFKEETVEVEEISDRVNYLETSIEEKAPLVNPEFTGSVTVDGSELATKEYAEGLIANIVNCAPSVVGTDNPLPTSDYKAGQTFRVADSGIYAGQKCESGDLIIVIADYVAGSASNTDFMCLQANIDGAVTSSTDVSTIGEIVVYDAVTGKIIKGSGINISSLNDVIAKSHQHENKAILDSYNKSQTELLETAAMEAQSKVDAYKEIVTSALECKADKAEMPDPYKTEVDTLLSPIRENLNTKVDAATVDSKISTAKEEITTAYTSVIDTKIGDLGESDDVVSYINLAVGSGGADVAEQINQAIATSKSYTDSALTIVEF